MELLEAVALRIFAIIGFFSLIKLGLENTTFWHKHK